MRNVVKCPRCGMELDVSSFAVGQTVACQCGEHLTVPTPTAFGDRPTAAGGQQPPPFGGQPPPVSGWPPGQPYGHYPPPTIQCKEATLALVLGIIGFVTGCVGIILGPIAISKANQAQRMIRADPRLQGEGMATAGKVLGIIATIFGALAAIYFLFVIIAMIAAVGSGP